MIIPGILEQDFENVKIKVKLVDSISKLIQIDINDGTLFDGKTFLEPTMLDTIDTNAQFELHLMVKNPLPYVQHKIKSVSKMLCHVESDNLDEFFTKCKGFRYKIGLSIDAETPTTTLNEHLSSIDYVQYMTINTGKSGQPFKIGVLKKIEQFHNAYPKITIQTDGGANEKTIPLLKQIGVSSISLIALPPG